MNDTTKINEKTVTIDARGRTLGRVASEAASALRGKNSPSFAPNEIPNISVVIKNATLTDISQKKKKGETYERYSGYPSGRTVSTMEKVLAEKGVEEVYRIAVRGMLPANKLRPVAMKNLIVED